MGNTPSSEGSTSIVQAKLSQESMPRPTPQFRRRAWREFQRALDPLAPPKPLKARGLEDA